MHNSTNLINKTQRDSAHVVEKSEKLILWLMAGLLLAAQLLFLTLEPVFAFKSDKLVSPPMKLGINKPKKEPITMPDKEINKKVKFVLTPPGKLKDWKDKVLVTPPGKSKNK